MTSKTTKNRLNNVFGKTMLPLGTSVVSMVRFLILSIVIFGIAGSDLIGSEFGVRFGAQRLDNSHQAFRPKVGLFYTFPLNSSGKMHLQLEAYYSSFRFEYAGSSAEGTAQANKLIRYYDNLQYIEVPVLIKYRLPLMGDLQPVVLAGGYAAFRLSDRLPRFENELSSDFWAEYGAPLVREYHGVEGGLVVGLGIEHVGSKTRLTFDIRLNIGLSDMASITYDTSRSNLAMTEALIDLKQRNHSLGFMMGISF